MPNYSGFVDLNKPKIFRGIFESGEVREYKGVLYKNKELNMLEITINGKIAQSESQIQKVLLWGIDLTVALFEFNSKRYTARQPGLYRCLLYLLIHHDSLSERHVPY